MPINALPPTPYISEKDGRLTSLYQSFMDSVRYWLGPVGGSGSTANRPIESLQNPLYISQMFFDTTLGKPIWVKSRNPTVWVDATGAAV